MIKLINYLVVAGFLVLLVMACEQDLDEQPQPTYTIEGRWLGVPVSGFAVNTMYEFKDGIRYTYYCSQPTCDQAYWNSLKISDAIPGPHSYTLIEDMLTIDLNFGNKLVTVITFDCEGGKVNFVTSGFSLFKVGVDQNCK
jgi:hypothetical protein